MLRQLFFKAKPLEPTEGRKTTSNFQVPIPVMKNEVIEDTFVNPRKMILSLPDVVNNFRCTICQKFSADEIYECEENGHVVCRGCRQFFVNGTCLVENGSLCGKRVLSSKSSVLQCVMKSSKFVCPQVGCETLVEGELWASHLKDCKTNLLKCRDDHCCSEDPIPMEHFVEHCESVHQLKPKTLTTDGIQFELRKPLDSPSGLQNSTIVSTFKADNRIMYVAAHFSDSFVMISCFLLNDGVGDREFLMQNMIEVIPVPKLKHEIIVDSAIARINHQLRDEIDLKHFGRSINFPYAELDLIHSHSLHVYSMTLKIKKFDERVPFCNTTWTANIDRNLGWRNLIPDEPPSKPFLLRECVYDLKFVDKMKSEKNTINADGQDEEIEQSNCCINRKLPRDKTEPNGFLLEGIQLESIDFVWNAIRVSPHSNSSSPSDSQE